MNKNKWVKIYPPPKKIIIIYIYKKKYIVNHVVRTLALSTLTAKQVTK